MRKANFDKSSRQPWNKLAGTNRDPREVRGKHTTNPGYKEGDNWVECQRCGMDVYGSQAREDGYKEGLIVCPSCYDAPHPQDYVKAFEDTLEPASFATGPDDTVNIEAGTDVDGNTTTWTSTADGGAVGSTSVPAGTTNTTDPL